MTEQVASTSTPSSSSLVFRNFIQACRGPETRRKYRIGIHSFTDYLQIPRNEYGRLLEKAPKSSSRTYAITYYTCVKESLTCNNIPVSHKLGRDYSMKGLEWDGRSLLLSFRN